MVPESAQRPHVCSARSGSERNPRYPYPWFGVARGSPLVRREGTRMRVQGVQVYDVIRDTTPIRSEKAPIFAVRLGHSTYDLVSR